MNNYEAKEKVIKKLEMVTMLLEECDELSEDYDVDFSLDIGDYGVTANVWSSSSEYC